LFKDDTILPSIARGAVFHANWVIFCSNYAGKQHQWD
jgi:hypothetical protein